MLLYQMRLQGWLNAVRRRPLRYLLGALLLGLVFWGVLVSTVRGVHFTERFLQLGNADIAEAIFQRSLEALFTMLLLSVAFSVLTTAIHTLYASEDLAFLLALPVSPAQVFGLKVGETYLSAALMPALFTVPVLVGLGIARASAPLYYPLALVAVLALYALPVALGSLVALVLIRISPAGRVKEVATALSVVLAAGLIFGLRALRPERLAGMDLAELSRFIERFSSFSVGWSPTSLASSAVWSALSGRPGWSLVGLLCAALALLYLVGLLAALAYGQGWLRAQATGSPRLDPSVRGVAMWERPLARLGAAGAIVIKDVRLLLRDPTQWSQLLVLLALAGVYLTSVGSLRVEGLDSQRFRDALGAMNVLFLGLLLAGVGVRIAYPLVSLEGEGFWLLKTGPVSSAQIVLGKFWHSLPIMLVLGLGLGVAAAVLIDLSPALAWASPLAGACAALAITGLGTGLGAAFPRFDATSLSEVPLSAGGLLYMALSLGYSTLLMLALAWPAWQFLRYPDELVWNTPGGWLVLALVGVVTLLSTVLPLLYGTYRLARYEVGD